VKPITENIIEESDIELFKKIRNIWIQCLTGKHKNSISNQLYSLSWNINSYRIINESRIYASKNEKGELKQNAMLHILIDNLFFENTLLKIRNLTDSSYPLDSGKIENNKDVYSIISLLNDMKKHSKYMTRGNLFEVEDIEYDQSIINDKKKRFMQENGKQMKFIPKECSALYNISRHKQIDKLCGNDISIRAKNNTINSDIFQKLIDGIKSKSTVIKTIVDQQIAHASTPIKDQNLFNSISIKKIVDIYIVIGIVSNFLQDFILNRGITLNQYSLTPHFDLFEYLDEPLIQTENLHKLTEKWNACQEDLNNHEVQILKDNLNVNDFLKKVFA